MQREGAAINFNTVCAIARVSKTFLYDPKHSDLAQQIRSLRQVTHESGLNKPARANKSDSAKDAQIARFKERSWSDRKLCLLIELPVCGRRFKAPRVHT